MGRRLGLALSAALALILVLSGIPQDAALAAASATTQVTFAGKLDSSAADGTSLNYNVGVYDAAGASHPISFVLTKVPSQNAWDWQATNTDPAITTTNPLATGTVAFDTAGVSQTSNPLGTMILQYTAGTTQVVNVVAGNLSGPAQTTTFNLAANGSSATPPAPAPAPDKSKHVILFGRRFTPSTLKFALPKDGSGVTVQWANDDRVAHHIAGNIWRDIYGQVHDITPSHTLTSLSPGPPLDSGVMAAWPPPAFLGAERDKTKIATFSQTFTEPGIYSYHCTIHPTMAGQIVITNSDGQITTGGGSSGGITPPPPPPGPTPTPAAAPKIVTVFGNRFLPAKITITQGTTLQFRNGDRKDHQLITATYRSADGVSYDWSPNPDPSLPAWNGDKDALNTTIAGRPTAVPGSNVRPELPPIEQQFNDPGVYSYRGEVSSMRGTIVVVTPTPTQ